MTDVLGEEQAIYHLQHGGEPKPKAPDPSTLLSLPKRTGYEKYQDPGFIPEIQAKSSVWGTSGVQKERSITPQPQPEPRAVAVPPRKMLSLEEVEAQMRGGTQPQMQPQPQSMSMPIPLSQVPAPQFTTNLPQAIPPPSLPPPDQRPVPPDGFVPFPADDYPPLDQHQQFPQLGRDGFAPPPGFQRPQLRQMAEPPVPGPGIPPHIIQHQNRHPAMVHQRQPSHPPTQVPYSQPQQPMGPGAPMPATSMPPQLMQLPEEQRRMYLEEDAKRAKRNHKIFMLSKGNGLMTPQDKNFITRIQLQQLVAASGSLGETDIEALLGEDFYYQVYSQIRGAPRQHPRQPLGHFAQTYLFQSGGRQTGNMGRRHYHGADNHMQRMQQQVQRAVEAAKLKPKNKQLIIEGSLGKISFSNAKTPRPLLNIKRPDSADGLKPGHAKKASQAHSTSDRKSILRNLENVYAILMMIEDHERNTPPNPEGGDDEAVEAHLQWRQKLQTLKQSLWENTKILEPIIPGSHTTHPFIAFLSHPKGKKAITRIFRHVDQEQRTTILTMIMVHLDSLDVVQRAQLQPGEPQPAGYIREEIDLFSQTVMPSLLLFVNEAQINIVIGLLGLIIAQTNVQTVSRAKIGLGILTMLLSRAELVKEAGSINDQDLMQWTEVYNQLFDRLEPILSEIFPGTINSGDDMYVWQFLAALGIGASPQQQQRLVIAVK